MEEYSRQDKMLIKEQQSAERRSNHFRKMEIRSDKKKKKNVLLVTVICAPMHRMARQAESDKCSQLVSADRSNRAVAH